MKTIQRWRRSGLTARKFAERDDISAAALWWWSSTLGRATRAVHGLEDIEPIEIAVGPAAAPSGVTSRLEIAVGTAVVRFDVGADVSYVAALVRALDER